MRGKDKASDTWNMKESKLKISQLKSGKINDI